jgi:hypothetical protein
MLSAPAGDNTELPISRCPIEMLARPNVICRRSVTGVDPGSGRESVRLQDAIIGRVAL